MNDQKRRRRRKMSSSKSKKVEAQKAAVKAAIESVGLGYDLAEDLKLKYCKRSSRLIVIDDDQVRDLVVPAGIAVRNVPKSIKCDKGERLRFASDVLSFQQVTSSSRTITQLVCLFCFYVFPLNLVCLLPRNYYFYEHLNSHEMQEFCILRDKFVAFCLKNEIKKKIIVGFFFFFFSTGISWLVCLFVYMFI